MQLLSEKAVYHGLTIAQYSVVYNMKVEKIYVQPTKTKLSG